MSGEKYYGKLALGLIRSSGTWTPITGVLYFGYANGGYDGVNPNTGTLTVDGGAINQQVDKVVLGRAGGTGALILKSGAINVWTTGSGSVSANVILSIPNNDNRANHASVFVNGGTLTLGNSNYAARIQMMPGASSSGETAFFSQTGGVVNAGGGITIGASSGAYAPVGFVSGEEKAQDIACINNLKQLAIGWGVKNPTVIAA